MQSPPPCPHALGRADHGLPTGRRPPPYPPQAPGVEGRGGGRGMGEGAAGRTGIPRAPGQPGPPTPPPVGGPAAYKGPALNGPQLVAAVMTGLRRGGKGWLRTASGRPAGRPA